MKCFEKIGDLVSSLPIYVNINQSKNLPIMNEKTAKKRNPKPISNSPHLLPKFKQPNPRIIKEQVVRTHAKKLFSLAKNVPKIYNNKKTKFLICFVRLLFWTSAF